MSSAMASSRVGTSAPQRLATLALDLARASTPTVHVVDGGGAVACLLAPVPHARLRGGCPRLRRRRSWWSAVHGP